MYLYFKSICGNNSKKKFLFSMNTFGLTRLTIESTVSS